MAAAQLRAPLYEDKVVDFLFEKAEISEREVTREELEAAIESEEGFMPAARMIMRHDHDHDQGQEGAAKKAAPAETSLQRRPPTRPKAAADEAKKPADEERSRAEPEKKPAAKKAAKARRRSGRLPKPSPPRSRLPRRPAAQSKS